MVPCGHSSLASLPLVPALLLVPALDAPPVLRAPAEATPAAAVPPLPDLLPPAPSAIEPAELLEPACPRFAVPALLCALGSSVAVPLCSPDENFSPLHAATAKDITRSQAQT